MSNFYGAIGDPGLYVNGNTEGANYTIIDSIPNGDVIDDFPVYANCILTGVVTSAQAFLSRDRTWVYSDFDVKVESILKQDVPQPLSEGGNVVTYRTGGALRFPSGHVTHYIIANQGFPNVGDRYLFFLWRWPDLAGRYELLTGYQLKDEKAYLLDGAQHVVNGQYYDEYEEMSEGNLLTRVKKAIAAERLKTQNK